ncbi:MAG: peptide MFS transporter [Parachlamydiaceae bacterium]
MKNQPKGFYLLNFASMWECFSYYGMRALLVLFMVKELRLSDSEAYATYALYITLVELGGVLGGILADKYLSLKGAITIGGWAIFCGHLLLGFSEGVLPLFFLSLGLIVAGTNLFRVNIPAAIGNLYEEEDSRRDRGFTLFYATINIGGLLATLVCGILGETYGWHYGFGAAAFGMLLGNIALLLKGNVIKELSWKKSLCGIAYIIIAAPSVAGALYAAQSFAPFATFLVAGTLLLMYRKVMNNAGLRKLAGMVLFLVLFYACEELLGSSLVVFAERHVDRVTWFGEIPASTLSVLNPLTILLAGAFVARGVMSPLSKIQMSLLFLTGAFILLYYAAGLENTPLAYAVASIAAISIGELFIGPTIYAESAKVSPKNERGFTMAIVTLGFSLANLLSGVLSQQMASEEASSHFAFQEGFGMIAILVCVILGISFISKRFYENQIAKI